MEAWCLAATGLLAGCTMDSTPPGTMMNSSLGDAGRIDASTANTDGGVADAGRSESADAHDAGSVGDGAAWFGPPQDGSYQCVGQSATADPCTEFLLNPQFQRQWSLRLSKGDLDIVTAGFDLDEISCTGQVVGVTFRCFATMHVNGAVCDDQLNLQPAANGAAIFWIGEDANPPPIRASCERSGP